MLTQEEITFLQYWEANRDKEKKTSRQFLMGIPIGLLFGLPILINYFSGWNKRATMVGNSSPFMPVVLLAAIIIICIFSAIFYKKYRWEQNEQRYLELKYRQDRDKEEDEA